MPVSEAAQEDLLRKNIAFESKQSPNLFVLWTLADIWSARVGAK